MSITSICIPSIERNISSFDIKKTFEKLNIGKINNIIIKKKNKHSTAFIYLQEWNITCEKAKTFQKKIIDGEEVNLIYDFPWFWKCRANHDIRELKFNKLENKSKQQEQKINYLKNQNWNLQCYARWLSSRRGNDYPQTI